MSSDVEYYFITYKKLTGAPTQSDYDACYDLIRRRGGEFVQDVYETDAKGRLHVHYIVNFNRRNPYFRNMVIPDYSMKSILIYDIDTLMHKYLRKQVINDNESGQLADSNYCETRYMFDDE